MLSSRSLLTLGYYVRRRQRLAILFGRGARVRELNSTSLYIGLEVPDKRGDTGPAVGVRMLWTDGSTWGVQSTVPLKLYFITDGQTTEM